MGSGADLVNLSLRWKYLSNNNKGTTNKFKANLPFTKEPVSNIVFLGSIIHFKDKDM